MSWLTSFLLSLSVCCCFCYTENIFSFSSVLQKRNHLAVINVERPSLRRGNLKVITEFIQVRITLLEKHCHFNVVKVKAECVFFFVFFNERQIITRMCSVSSQVYGYSSAEKAPEDSYR